MEDRWSSVLFFSCFAGGATFGGMYIVLARSAWSRRNVECCTNPHPLGIIAFAGMTLHSLIDGLIIGTGFGVSRELGFLSAMAVIAHEVPEGVAILAILLHYGYSRRSAILLASTVALATPLAAMVACAMARDVDHFFLGGTHGAGRRIFRLYRRLRPHPRIPPRPGPEGKPLSVRRNPDRRGRRLDRSLNRRLSPPV